jgi:hypothetical protein
MPDTEKYRNPPSIGREDDNKHGWKLGDIVHIAGSYMIANKYNYCGYEEFEIPTGSRARIIGIKQTDLNSTRFGNGDVYIDFELVEHANSDGTLITCGNRHAWSMAEANPDFTLCPDGSGDPGYFRREGFRNSGLWESIEGTQIEDHPDGYMQWRPRKVVDPHQYM